MTDWLCWHVGTVTDPKLSAIAQRSKVSRPIVISFWAYLLERGRVADLPGSVGKIDIEDASFAIGATQQEISDVFAAMQSKGMIADDRIANWQKRQHKTSTERVRDHRERNRTQGNAGNVSMLLEHPCNGETDVQTDSKKKKEERSASCDATAGAALEVDLKSQIFGPLLTTVIARTGRTEVSCRSWLGKLCSTYGDGPVIEAITIGCRNGAIDFIPYITQTLKERGPNGTHRNGNAQTREQRFAEIALRTAESFDFVQGSEGKTEAG